MSNQFIILGSIVDDDPTFWNEECGWTSFKPFATIYDQNILTLPLPEGGACIQEQTEVGVGIALYTPSPLYSLYQGTGLTIFEKLP